MWKSLECPTTCVFLIHSDATSNLMKTKDHKGTNSAP